MTSGWNVAADQARSALGGDRLVAVLPHLQEASLPPLLRSSIRRQHIELDTTRNELAEPLGAEDVEHVKLWRVTRKSLLDLVLLAVATYTIIGMISGLDLDAFGRSLADATWWWLLAALLIGQLPRLANALSTMGSTPQPLSFGPTAALQFATCYANLAVASTAGRVAITTRCFHRFGIPAAAALSAGVIDSVSALVVQITPFLLMFLISCRSPARRHGASRAAVLALLERRPCTQLHSNRPPMFRPDVPASPLAVASNSPPFATRHVPELPDWRSQSACPTSEPIAPLLGVVPTSEQRRLFRPWDCSDLKADLPGRQRVPRARGRNNPAPWLTRPRTTSA